MKGLIINTPRFKIGDRVKVFDHTLYINDVITPPDVTFKDATIVAIGDVGNLGETVDVVFDYNRKLSKAHFTCFIERL